VLIWQRWPAPAGKVENTSELQAYHCMTPEQWTGLLRIVSAVLANKVSLHEINQLIGIELMTSSFLEKFGT